jgi:predicted alpha/beta hydrolase family esterase
MVVASANDPYASIAFSRACARHWGSSLVEAGPLGHINAASNLGEWAWGRAQLRGFAAGIGQGAAPA